MGFKLASAFVSIGMDDKQFNRGLKGIRAGMEGLRPAFSAVQTMAKVFLGALVGATIYSVKAAADSEMAQHKLRSALEATGQEVDGNAERLLQFSQHLADITTHSKGAIAAQMAFATNMGVSAEQMENATKLAIGLAHAFFGGDLQAGMEAAAKAQQGNVRQLKQMIPAIKDAVNSQQALEFVIARGRVGFTEAQKETETLSGQLEQLHNRLGQAAKGFGNLLLPYIKTATEWLKRAAESLTAMDDPTRQAVARFAAIGAAIAGVLVFGPTLIGFASTAASTFLAIGKIVAGVGVILINLVTSPFALVIAGIAAVATAFLYLGGSGTDATSRIKSGFERVLGFIRFVFQNTSSASQAWSVLMKHAGFVLEDAFAAVKEAIVLTWVSVKDLVQTISLEVGTFVIRTWITVAQAFAEVWAKATTKVTKGFNDVRDGVAAAMVDAKELLGLISGDEANRQRTAIGQRNLSDNAAADAKGAQDQAGIKAMGDLAQSTLKALHDTAAAEQRRETEAGLVGAVEERRRREQEVDAARKAFDESVKQQFKESGGKSLQDRLAELADKLKSATGLNELQDLIKKLQGLADDAKNAKPGQGGGPPEGIGDIRARRGAHEVIAGKGLEEAFKEDIKNRLVGAVLLKQQQAREAERREADRRKIKAAERTAEASEAASDLLDKLLKKNPAGAFQ